MIFVEEEMDQVTFFPNKIQKMSKKPSTPEKRSAPPSSSSLFVPSNPLLHLSPVLQPVPKTISDSIILRPNVSKFKPSSLPHARKPYQCKLKPIVSKSTFVETSANYIAVTCVI